MKLTSFTINIAGGDTRYLNAEGDNLLRAGLRAGIGLPYECSAGGCGSCKFDVLSGEVEEMWPDAPGLSAKDRVRGRRLACQCRPLSDCEIKIRPGPEYLSATAPARFKTQYLGSRQVTVDIREFMFRAEQPAQFVPGQYALLDLPGVGQLRAYSMSNQPNEAGDWHFMVRQVPNGRVSTLMFDALQPGDSVEIDGPLGLAQLRAESPRDVVCIAGGSGLAPMLSIVNAVAMQPALNERAIWLFYGGRSPADIPTFADWLHKPDRVQVTAAVSAAALAESDGWQGERGFVHELLGRSLSGDLAAHEYYLAGPPPMIEVVVRMLMIEHRVPAQQIHYDRFF
ncbi:2Fe-2S iron-sulfur cluster-binding protein [Rhodoferax ferrireducens]|uniref:2Fe-2S iron-sulfur cluster-binding protein n=1 Tax=Rhodoferax ferrireducens TaxID=192843 RepID=UPI000E0DCFB7|nr:2Fe-2S iron-sulfur cluster-binding protein [Rhodoferax ferrireducens]